jgi:hypothetical protein
MHKTNNDAPLYLHFLQQDWLTFIVDTAPNLILRSLSLSTGEPSNHYNSPAEYDE